MYLGLRKSTRGDIARFVAQPEFVLQITTRPFSCSASIVLKNADRV
jgi:hypothetical protein